MSVMLERGRAFMNGKWNYLCIAVVAGMIFYVGIWALCFGDVYTMTPDEYARQAKQIVDCSLSGG